MTPRVAIVVPAWNAEAYLLATVRSVQEQSLAEWSMVIVDDGSTDHTAAIAAQLAGEDDRIRALTQANGGVACARNRGLRESRADAEMVIFLDNDDLWLPDTLETLADALREHSDCVSAHGLVRCIDPEGRRYPDDDMEDRLRRRLAASPDGPVLVGADSPTPFEALALENCIVTPGVHLMRRRVLERVGGFDPGVVPCDDWDLSLRLARVGPIAYVGRALLLWRRHPGNASNVLSRRWRHAYFGTRVKAARDPANSPQQRAAALFGMRATAVRLAGECRHGLARGDIAGAVRSGATLAYACGRWAAAARGVR